jgi:hypothetical protein
VLVSSNTLKSPPIPFDMALYPFEKGVTIALITPSNVRVKPPPCTESEIMQKRENDISATIDLCLTRKSTDHHFRFDL